MRLVQFINEAETSLPLSQFSSLLTPAVVTLNNVAKQNNFEIRIVGGAVRDLVLGLEPKDIDMATDATPQQLIQLLDKAGIRYKPTGLQHGTITAILDGEPIEITTLRVDTETNGRHATVKFTTNWKRDAERRDLTFNAMSLGLDGTLYDYFNGVQDLTNHIARFVGNASIRIKEDYLRILRYFRFQGRLNRVTWDATTLNAIDLNRNGLRGISGERIWAEMSKILSRSSAVDVLNHMNDVKVLDVINLPTNRILKLSQTQGNNPIVKLATLLNSVGGLATLRSYWKFGNAEYNMARFIIENRENGFDENIAKLMLAEPSIANENIIALAESLGKSYVMQKLANWSVPTFPVTGADLIQAGVSPGPEMGQLIANMRQTWQDNMFRPTKSELMRGNFN